jgi:hypothetical protein
MLVIPNNFQRLPFSKRYVAHAISLPTVFRVWNNKLTKSNLLKKCIVFGSVTAAMHHLRKIADWRNIKRKQNFFTIQMMAINRKQLSFLWRITTKYMVNRVDLHLPSLSYLRKVVRNYS